MGSKYLKNAVESDLNKFDVYPRPCDKEEDQRHGDVGVDDEVGVLGNNKGISITTLGDQAVETLSYKLRPVEYL